MAKIVADTSIKKPPPPPRQRIVHFRMSEEEYAALSQKAEDAGMTLSALLRDQAGKVYVRHRSDEKKRLALINRLNANLNMIAKWVNTYKDKVDAVDVDMRLLDIEQQLERLLAALDRQP